MRLRDESGYGLIEAIATLAILGTIIGAITSLFVSGSRAQVQMNERFQAQNSARLALDRLRRDVHCSSSAVVSSTSAALTNTCLADTVTWCTVPSGAKFGLHRQPGGGACSASSQRFAASLTSGDVFTYQAPSISNLGKLRVELRVRLDSMKSDYRLCDLLVLRNTTRQGSTGVAIAPC